MRLATLALGLLGAVGCSHRDGPAALRGPLAVFEDLRPAPRVITGPAVVLFWLSTADTLPGPAWSEGGHSLQASLAELRDVLEGHPVVVGGTNRKQLEVASGHGPTRTVMLAGLDYPWGVVLFDPPYPEQILTGPMDDGELADLAWDYFQLGAEVTGARIAGYGWGAARLRRAHHQYGGSPAATIPSPATVCPMGCEKMLLSTNAAADRTKRAGVTGYPGIRNGRGASGSRRRKTNRLAPPSP